MDCCDWDYTPYMPTADELIARNVAAAQRTMREFISALTAKHHREFMGYGRFPAQIHDIRLKKHTDFSEAIMADGRMVRIPTCQHEYLTIECDKHYAYKFAQACGVPIGLEFLGIEGAWMVGEMLDKFWVGRDITSVIFKKVC